MGSFMQVFCLGIFALEFEKKSMSHLKSAPSKLYPKKSLNLEPKNPDFGIFGLAFENAIVIFEIGTFQSLVSE